MSASAAARLLAIDDDADSAELVARVAGHCGYEARALSDTHALPALLASWKPDVLTLDLCMPDTDGLDLLAVLQETGFTGVVVIVSGQDSWFRKAAARLAGTRGLAVVDDMQKPVDIAVLRQLLGRLRKAS
jgi:DNA-binding response OmpR family regulator